MELNSQPWTQQTFRLLDRPRFDIDKDQVVVQFRSVGIVINSHEEFFSRLQRAVEVLDSDQAVIRNYPDGPRQPAYAVRRRAVAPGDARIADYGLPVIVWTVAENGSLYAHFSHLPHQHWTMGDLQRATRDDYTEFDWTDVIIWESDGGAGGDQAEYDLISFLMDHGIELGIGATSWVGAHLTKLGLKLRRTRKSDRRARIAVRRWENRGFANPWMIRMWFETKGQWTVKEVAKRLQIAEPTAADTLRALGYQRLDEQRDLWILSTHPAAVRKRRKWKRSETSSELREDLY